MDKTRTYFAEKYLLGDGVEFGALHNPLIVGEQSQITYVDKLTKKELLKKFPELKDYAESIVSTDIILDIDKGDFSPLTLQKFDFFIANHVIEHLVNPIRFLEEIHEVMIPSSILYISVPNKEYTFDKYRELTSNDHLWCEYQDNTNELTTEHLNDFLLNITKDHIEPHRKAKMYFKNDKLPIIGFRKRRIYKLHKERSIHVHVWNQNTFSQFLNFTFTQLNLDFEIIDSNISSNNELDEIIYILKK